MNIRTTQVTLTSLRTTMHVREDEDDETLIILVIEDCC